MSPLDSELSEANLSGFFGKNTKTDGKNIWKLGNCFSFSSTKTVSNAWTMMNATIVTMKRALKWSQLVDLGASMATVPSFD